MFLFREVFENEVNTFRHLRESGGTVYGSTAERNIVQGVNLDSATVMTLDLNVMHKKHQNQL